MHLTLKIARPPVVQIALDYATIEDAMSMARIGIAAGVDWLEIGTPLIVSRGIAPIGQMVRAFPDFPVLADYKTMDSGWKNVERTAQQGGHVMTVCAASPDETVKAAIAEGRKTGVWVVADTIGVKNQAVRARQCADWGVNMIYLHYGADQRKADATRDSVQWLAEVQQAVSIPIGVGCFDAEDGARAARMGAELIAIGHPVISAADPLAALRHFVDEVKTAYRPRSA
jgi:3-hexulose-6-phosphate synthase/6-phospho-3-hexuloisomerase